MLFAGCFTMKIICAGVSHTGTKSLHEALNILGYNVYDFIDHFWEHDKYWKKIFEHGASSEDFRKMYENVDVIMDVPVFPFWEEISNAFPDAKVRTKIFVQPLISTYNLVCISNKQTINLIRENSISMLSHKLVLTFIPVACAEIYRGGWRLKTERQGH